MEQLQGDISDYLETNPTASLKDLIARFGEPTEMADSYIDSLDAAELQKQIRKSKTVKRIVLFTCLGILAAVLVVASIITIVYIQEDVTVVTYTVSEGKTIITDVSEVTQSEANNYNGEPTTSIVVDNSIQDVVSDINQK